MSETTLDVPFKGRRDYLHSTNIWNAIASQFLNSGRPQTARLSVSFRRLIVRQPILSFPSLERPAAGVSAGDVVLVAGERRETGILKMSDLLVERRVDDYENGIRGDVTIEGDRASFAGKPDTMTAVEVIVAVIKFLHESAVSREVKWLATRLDLPLSLELNRSTKLDVAITHKTATLATMSDVIVDGSWCGKIAFNPMPVAAP